MSVELVIFVIAVCVLAGTAISILFSTWLTGSPPMPSGPALRREVLAMVAKTDPREGATYELGSGWGGLARALALANPGREVIGLERSFAPWCAAVCFRAVFGPRNLRFRLADFTRADLSDADVAVCYLSGETLSRAVSLLERALPKGCHVVSATFAWPGRVALDTARAGDLYRSPVYLYRLD